MKKSLLKILICPYCKKPFRSKSFLSEGREIIDGLLSCKCNTYPIIGGVPRIISPNMQKSLLEQYKGYYKKYKKFLSQSNTKSNAATSLDNIKIRIAERFGYEWKKFSKLYSTYENQFLDWIYPVKKDFFRNKLVLDMGCGTGRHMYFSALYGGEVVGVDLGGSVDVAFQNTKKFSNAHVVQADIYHLPFKKNLFDFVYCIGVLHHLPRQEEGFTKLVEVTKKKGLVHSWVYGREGNYLLKIMDPLRKYFISKLPLPIVKLLSFSLMVFIHPIIKLVYRPLNKFSITRKFASYLPQNSFFMYLSNFTFSVNYSILFDQLLAPIATYYTKEEFRKWFENAHLKNIKITWRNRNSWRGFGVKP
jgi:SAM-dependent methyltransferase